MSQATCHAAPPHACASAVGRASARGNLPAWPDGAAFAAALERLARPWRRWAAIRALHRLSDRELRDIGLGRGEIEVVVDQLMRVRS